MKRWFHASSRPHSSKKSRRQALSKVSQRAGLFRAIGWEQLEDRVLLTAQLVVDTVSDSGAGSLRDAITQANTDGGAIITFNIQNDSAQNPQTIGLFSALPALGNGITISGPGANGLTVTGRSQFQVFHVSAGATVSISGLAIENGRNQTSAVHGSATFVAGGGIQNDGTLTLTDDEVSNNGLSDSSGNVPEGAGIYNDGTLTISGSTVTNNFAGLGGGIANDGTLTITASTISGNIAAGGDSAWGLGGGIATSGALTVLDSTISGNVAASGGAGSASEADGGGIDGESGAVVNLTNCTIVGNSLQGANGTSLATGYGGGISGSSATFTLTNCTVAGNTAVTAGGGIDAAGQGSVTLNLTNSIVATNTVAAGGTNADINGAIAGADHDLIGDGTSSGVTNGANGNQVGTTASPIDPQFGPLSNNGGPTETMPLGSGSPAIDAGDNTAVANPPFPGPPFTDQRGTGLPRIVNGTVDIGAFEFSPIPNLVVTTTADDLDGGTLADPDGPDSSLSLREAITLANLEGGGIITFDIPGMSAQSPQTITLASALPALNAAITIAGPGSNELTVSGNDQVRVFNTTSGSIVSVSGLTIAHGFNNVAALNNGGVPFVAGGGISNFGTLTLTSDVLSQNVATDSTNNGFAAGGAVYNVGTLTVNTCTFTNNSASAIGGGVTPGAAGGAIDNDSLGVDTNLGVLTMTDSTISGNSVSAPQSQAIGAVGGGINNNSDATITACTISGNSVASTGSAQGGGIQNDPNSGKSLTLVDSTISGNSATVTGNNFSLAEGGGIDATGNGGLTLVNSTVANNTATSSDRAEGGGIDVFLVTATLANCTITGNADNFTNAPGSGGGGIFDAGTLGMANTIVAGNTETAGGSGADFSNDQSSGDVLSPDDHNLIGIGEGSGLTNGTHGDQVGPAASPLDAELGRLANNGGPTQTVALLAGSPAIDAGDNAAVANPPFPGPPFTDQRGTGFARIINGTVDIGAFEVLPTLVVNTTEDEIDGGTIANPSGTDGLLSLREAITVANLEGGAIITFAIPGDSAANPQTITLGSALPAITGAVTITGPGSDELTVSGDDQFQVFNVPSGSIVSISGLTVAHGFTDTAGEFGNPALLGGGGLANDGSLTLADDAFTDNKVSDAATHAFVGGGGILNQGTLSITGSSLDGNSVVTGDENYGGGLDNAGTLTMTDCTVTGNTAGIPGGGGAIGGGIANTGAATIDDSTISGNTALGDGDFGIGGGIGNEGSGTLALVNSTVSGNQAKVVSTSPFNAWGGGVANDNNSAATIVNCTIEGNSSTAGSGGQGRGGGFYDGTVTGRTSTVTNSTIADNSSGFGGGIQAAVAPLDLTNTIVADNTVTSGGTGPDIAGAVTTADHNLIRIGDGSSGVTNGTDGNQVGTAANPLDPNLGPLSNNGGPTETMALLAGSPAIDAGDNGAALETDGLPLTTDQRGTGFPRILNGTVDIGAIEYNPPPNLVVNTTADDNDGGTLADPDGADGTLSLREAIEVANAEGGANITFNIPGDSAQSPQTITLGSALPAITGAVTITGPGSDELTVSGNDHFQVFNVPSGSIVSISGLTIAHGFTADNGGGIRNEGTLSLANMVVTNCSTNGGYGGGIINEGDLTITGSILTENSVVSTGDDNYGGAIDNEGTLTLTNSIVSNNTAGVTGGNSAFGGGISNGGTATISASTFSGNTAVGDNGSPGQGGAIDSGDEGSGTLTIVDSTFAGNKAGAVSGSGGDGIGGALANDSGAVSLTNSTVAKNSTNGDSADGGANDGGGIYVFGSGNSVTLTNCTVSGNSAVQGGGIGAFFGATLNLTNTIVAGNTIGTGGTGPDVSGAVNTADHNLIGIGDGSTGVTNGTNGNQVGTVASPIDPKLGTLANNGGPTETMALQTGCPAIDAGDNAAVANPPFPGPPFTDQRGTGFPRIVNGTVDIGAFEFLPLPNLVVTSTSDDLDGGTLADPDGADGTLSLREAIEVANLDGGAIITFAIPGDSAANPQTITLGSALPAITGAVTITGPGADELSVSGDDNFQVFNVPSGSIVSISGLTIAHGVANTAGEFGNATLFGGGGIANNGTLTLTDDNFTDNQASDATGGNFGGGGAVLNQGTLSITNSSLDGNSTVGMGGDYNYGGALDNAGVLTMTDCTVTGNTAGVAGGAGGIGGGIANTGTATIDASTIRGNTALGDGDFGIGGGIGNEGSATLTLSDSTISDNQAEVVSTSTFNAFGGGVANDNNSAATMVNCTIEGNSTTAGAGGQSRGGGFYDGTVTNLVSTVTNCTIADNSSGFGGGIEAGGAPLDLTNTIVADNTVTSGGTGPDIAGPVTTADHNLIRIGDGSSGVTNGTNGNQVGTSASPTDPKLGKLANNGGPTETMALSAGSPAIDAGDNAAVANPPFPAPPFTDQRGTGFPRILNGTVDIGAIEYNPSPNLVVNTTADDSDGGTIANPDGSDGTLSLREAIKVANLEGGAIITFAIPGDSAANPQTITLGSALPAITGVLTITGPGADELTVSGNDEFQVFDVETTTGTVTIQNLTIADGNVGTGGGGGILNNGALNLTAVTISGNTAETGGGIDNGDQATLTVANSTITGNTAHSIGGGIGTSGSLTMVNSTISANTVSTSFAFDPAQGGGISDFGINPVSLTNCTIANNTVTSAGQGFGGGIAVFNDPATITNCTVTGNTVNFGTAGTTTVSGGGGIWNDTSIGLINTLVAGNTTTSGGSGPDVSNAQGTGTFSADDHNLIGIGDGSGLTNGKNGDLVGTAASPLDAKLGTLADNGGPTQTVALLAGSPAIDAGDNTAVANPPFPGPPFTDQRGTGFPRIINGKVDIGAFELLPNLVVNTTDDEIDGGTIANPSGTDGLLSLREAITVANLEGGAIITFDIPGDSAASPQTITLGSALPAITGVVTIMGPGSDELTVSGNDQFQVFNVSSGATVSISGLTIAHGFVDVPNVDQAVAGGGVLNQGILTLTGDTFTNNVASVPTGTTGAGNGAQGGAIYNDNNATLTADNCTFTNNSATSPMSAVVAGGAIANGTPVGNSEALCLINGCTFTGNSAVDTSTDAGTDALGGALSSFGTLMIANSTFSANTVMGPQAYGGGVSAEGGSAAISDSIIDGNTANGTQLFVGGGGIDAEGKSLTITDSTVSNNAATASAASINSSGGGVINISTTATITDCTISGNSVTGAAGAGGGIIQASRGTLTLTNCTVADNAAHGPAASSPNGGGIANGGPAVNNVAGTINLTNTVVARNTVDTGGAAPDFSGAVASADHNLIGIGDGSSGITNGTNGNQVGTASNPIDPKLGALANNGGSTQTMALLAGSPAIDAGDNAAVANPPFPGPPFTDQRGAGFRRILNGTVDIGAFEVQPVTPGTITWTGGSTTSGNWSDPANWDLNRAPINGDSVVFPDENVARTTNTNDISGLSLNSITFQDEAGGATATPYAITGDAVTLGAGGIVDGVSGTSNATHIDQLNLDITLGADQTWSMATTPPSTTAPKFEMLQLGGTITLGAFNLDLAANTPATNNTFELKGAVNGIGQISVDMSASGELYLGHANGYTGGTKVNSGTLFLGADGALGPAPGDGGTTVGNQAVLFVGTAYKTPEVVTVNGGTVLGFNFGPDSFAGPITFNSSNGTTDIAVSGLPFTLTGNVTFGSFDLHALNEAQGAATLVLDGAVNGGGTLQVLTGANFGGAKSSGPLTLAGTGTVTAPINVSSGSTLEPGDPNAATSTGTLHSASVTFQFGSTFATQLNGTAAGQFDQLDSTGTVTLGGATLNVTSAGGFAPGTKLVLIQAANPVAGTFNGLPEGSTVTAGGQNFTISYANDQVALTLPGVTPGTITWTGGSTTSANWSDPANWDLDRAPINGDSLVFPATAQQLANTNDISGLSVNSITFQGNFTTTTGGYTLSGDDLTVGAGGIVDSGTIPSGDTTSLLNQIGLNVTLAAAQSWSINDNNNFHHLTINGNVANGGFALTTAGNGTIDVAGQMSGSGSLTVNAGATGNFLTVDLDHANTYTGGTKVTNGFVRVFSDGALGPGGANDAGTTVGPFGQLVLLGVNYSTPEVLTLDGILGADTARPSSFAGPITITGAASGTGNGLPVPADAQINDFGGATFTINSPTLVNNGNADLFIQGGNLALGGTSVVVLNSVMSGTGGLLISGATVQLAAANTYHGSTYLFGLAELDVGVDNAIPSTSAVTMQAGAGNNNLIQLAGHSDTIGSLAGTQSGGATNTFDLGTGGSLTTGGDNTSTNFAGDITGSGTLTKQGSGTFDLTATNDYTGTTTVSAGTLIVDGSTPAGNTVTVDSGATLGGAGTISGNTVVGGTLDPGAGPDPSADTGTLDDNGDVTTFQTGSTFAVQLGGTAASPANDELSSTGAVSLTGATLNVSLLAGTATFNGGQTFVLVQASAPVSGTFSGLPEGSIVNAGGQNFSISYANDKVTLTTLPPLVVTTAADDNDGGTLADPLGADGTLSLREAIELANLYGGHQTISFNIPGGGVQTIHVGSTGLGSLPAITVPVTIDGYTQPGASPSTLTNGDNAVILIALDGDATDGKGNDVTGIQLTGGNSTVRGLAIGDFGTSNAGAEGQPGISITGPGGNTIIGNFIGTDATGKAAAANFTAVEIVGSSNNTVGGTTPADRNILSGNGAGGGVAIRIAADKTPASGNVVEGNFIGLDATGKTALDNNGTGVDIVGASGNTIGGTEAGAGNVISGNDGAAVGLEADLSSITVGNQAGATGLDAQNNMVEGNLIGTDVSGTAAIGNGNVDGAVFILGQPGTNDNNIIGGTTAAARNVVSGNGYSGIEISGDGNLIEGNYIGPDITGTKLLSLAGQTVTVGNGENGIFIDGGSNNTIGGAAAGAGNVISGNGDPTQSTGDGILVEPFYNTIQGQATIHNATGNLIEGNLIGVDATGQKTLGNIEGGIVLDGVSGNQVGGTAAGVGNVISANGAVGVGILGDNINDGLGNLKPFDAKNNIVEGNFMGTDRTGTLKLGNGTVGVAIASIAGSAANNTIGGTAAAAGNTIAFNKLQGVVVGHAASETVTTGNAIEGNLIYGNGGIGIDLGNDGVTQNTPGGPHTGPNDLQNFPVITSAAVSGSSTTIVGTFNSTPNQTFTLEFYSDSAADPSGHGQGETFLGRTTVTTDANGNASGNGTFTATVAAPPAGQAVFSATATDASGNTSEFSADFQAPTQTATYLNGQAGDNTVATFIHNLYRELLGREPEATGQAFWVNAYNQALAGGTAAKAQETVVAGFLASTEYRTHLVIGMYHDFLHRTPEAQGLQFWVTALANGMDEKLLLAEFVGSQEYFNDAGGSVPDWVSDLYHDLLGRAPEAGGLASWEQQAKTPPGQSLDRVKISLDFLSAPETEHKLLDAAYPGTAAVGAPGSAAVGAYALADITGDGWENLYFQGELTASAVDALFAELQAGAAYDAVIAGLLDMPQYFAA